MMANSSVHAHAYYGEPVSGSRLSAISGSHLAAGSGPYIGRGNKCVANDDTCEGNRVKDEHLCAGHLRSYNKSLEKAMKAETKPEVVDGV